MPESWWILASVAALIAIIVGVWRPIRTAVRESRFSRARRDFHRQRERLEAKFVRLAAGRAKPGAPQWTDCEFDDDVAYVRNRSTGELAAFVAVAVSIDGLGSEGDGLGITGNVRAGTAIFRFGGQRWDTDGRAILNLSPAEAIRYYKDDLEIVGQELASR